MRIITMIICAAEKFLQLLLIVITALASATTATHALHFMFPAMMIGLRHYLGQLIELGIIGLNVLFDLLF